LGICAFEIFGSSGFAVSFDSDVPVSVCIEGDGAGACCLGWANRFGRLVEGVGCELNGVDASFAGCGVESLGASVAGVAFEPNPENVDVWEGSCANRPLPCFGCALNAPGWGFEKSVFAGCGVLKPGKKFLGAAGAASDGFSAAGVLESFCCPAPRKLNPELGLLAGGAFARDANRFGLGVSWLGVLALCSGAWTLPNRGLGVEACCSGTLRAAKGFAAVLAAFGVCCPNVKAGVDAPDVGSPEKRLLAGAEEGVTDAPKRFEAGAAVVDEGALDAPNRFWVGGVVVVLFAPKLNCVVGVAVAVALLVPNKFCLGVSCWLAAPFCALLPKPPKLFCAGAVAFCPDPNPPNALPPAEVVAVFCAGVLLAPKLKAGVGWLGVSGVALTDPNRFPLLPLPKVPEVALVDPKPAPVLAALVPLFCDWPPNMLVVGFVPNRLPP